MIFLKFRVARNPFQNRVINHHFHHLLICLTPTPLAKLIDSIDHLILKR